MKNFYTKQYINKINKQSLKEGVADKYAEKEFYIPDEKTEFEKKYRAKQIKEEEKDKVIYNFGKSIFIVKNPSNLDKFQKKARAIINEKGDLYVLNINMKDHEDMLKVLSMIGEIEYQNKWHLKIPKTFVTLERLENENKFVLGESNEPMLIYIGLNRRKEYSMPESVNSARKFYEPFINKAQEINPQYKFINKTGDELYFGEVSESLNEKFAEESDPIYDMGIGILSAIKDWIKSKGYDYIDKDYALKICVYYGKEEFVKYLIEAGADVNYKEDDALRWASYNGNTEVVKLLLDAGADVHANDDEALRLASNNGHTEVVKILLDAGANVHDRKDFSLRWASYFGHTEVVKILLDAGANVHAENDEALRMANKNGHTEVVKILKDHIAKEKLKESLNEKFTEDSDPIHDLGIGLKGVYDNIKIGDIFQVKKYINLGFPSLNYYIKITKVEDFPKKEWDKRISCEVYSTKKNLLKNIQVQNEYISNWGWNYKFFKEYFKVINKINEKFTEDSDPVYDLGIGVGTYDNLSKDMIFLIVNDINPMQKECFPQLGEYIIIRNVKEEDSFHIKRKIWCDVYKDIDSLKKREKRIRIKDWWLSSDYFKQHFKFVSYSTLK